MAGVELLLQAIISQEWKYYKRYISKSSEECNSSLSAQWSHKCLAWCKGWIVAQSWGQRSPTRSVITHLPSFMGVRLLFSLHHYLFLILTQLYSSPSIFLFEPISHHFVCSTFVLSVILSLCNTPPPHLHFTDTSELHPSFSLQIHPRQLLAFRGSCSKSLVFHSNMMGHQSLNPK